MRNHPRNKSHAHVRQQAECADGEGQGKVIGVEGGATEFEGDP